MIRLRKGLRNNHRSQHNEEECIGCQRRQNVIGANLFVFDRALIRPMIKKIDILYHEKCSHYPQAIERVKQVLSEEGIDAEIREIQITSEEEARKYKFFGSPTIRIDDEDLESEEERQQGHAHVLDSCRIYNYKGQLYMIPHKEALRLALRKRK